MSTIDKKRIRRSQNQCAQVEIRLDQFGNEEPLEQDRGPLGDSIGKEDDLSESDAGDGDDDDDKHETAAKQVKAPQATVKGKVIVRGEELSKNGNSMESSRELHFVNSNSSKGVKQSYKYMISQQHGRGVIPKARIKTIKMTLVIVAAYVLCWSPFFIINICVVFGFISKDTDVTIALSTLTQSLAHLNSAANPIIFWLFSSKRHNNQKARTRMTNANKNEGPSKCFNLQNLYSIFKNILCCHCLLCCWNSDKGLISTDSKMFDVTDAHRTSTTLDSKNTPKAALCQYTTKKSPPSARQSAANQ